MVLGLDYPLHSHPHPLPISKGNFSTGETSPVWPLNIIQLLLVRMVV